MTPSQFAFRPAGFVEIARELLGMVLLFAEILSSKVGRDTYQARLRYAGLLSAVKNKGSACLIPYRSVGGLRRTECHSQNDETPVARHAREGLPSPPTCRRCRRLRH